MPNWVYLIPSEGPSVSEGGSEGSGAFNASFGGWAEGPTSFFVGILGEVIHLSHPDSHKDRKSFAI